MCLFQKFSLTRETIDCKCLENYFKDKWSTVKEFAEITAPMPPTDGPGMSGVPFDFLVDYGLRENTQGKCYFKGQVSLFAVNDPLTMMTMSRSQKVLPWTL